MRCSFMVDHCLQQKNARARKKNDTRTTANNFSTGATYRTSTADGIQAHRASLFPSDAGRLVHLVRPKAAAAIAKGAGPAEHKGEFQNVQSCFKTPFL